MRQRLRIFISSPGDVRAAREIAALTIERMAQDYARFFEIEPYLWEYEAMVASGHFQDSIEPPSAFDVVVLILWSRLGLLLPERTTVREYCGIDGRTPLTGTEWEFEEALHAAQKRGAPDLLVYRSMKPASFDTRDRHLREQQLQQFTALDGFWGRHFANQGMFLGAYTSFFSDAEFAAAFENHLRKLIEKRIAALGATQGPRVVKAWLQAPFRGLESYEFEHAPILFGQDEALAKAMLQLTGNAGTGSPFLLVLGASGSGKSSLAKAGILPKLFVARRVPGAAFLRRVLFRPSDARDGEDLFAALARRLTTQVSDEEGVSELIGPGQSLTSLASHLRNASAEPAYPIGTALGQLSLKARQDGRMLEYESPKLVLVVDQLEELFTVERITSEQRRRFVDLLAALVRSDLVWVVATMRIDFWHRAHEAPELVRLSEGNGRLELLPPGPAQLSQMIRRPAEAAGVHFEVHPTTNVSLNEVIAEEVAHDPGALPLLSYLLDQLYRADVLEADGATLTYATYERLGRLEGAIATQAETVLQRCAPEDRLALGSVLFSLVELGVAEGNIERAIARRVPLATFRPGTPQRRLVEALLDPHARLLVSDAEKEGSPTVRVAHEALISRWGQARDFVQSNAEALKIRHRIEERYALWRGLEAGGQEALPRETAPLRSLAARLAAWRSRLGREHGLLSDIDLTDGRRLLREHRSDTEPHLIAYVEHSIIDDKRIRTRSFRVLSAVASVVTLLAIAASGAGLVASKRQHEAQYQAQRAERESQKATAVKDFLLDVFKQSSVQNPGGVEARKVTAEQLLDVGATRIKAQLRNQPEVREELMDTLAELNDDLGLTDRAKSLATDNLAELQARTGNRPSAALAKLQVRLAATLVDRNEIADAKNYLHKALNSLGAVDELGSVAAASAYFQIARAAYDGTTDDKIAGVADLRLALDILKQRDPTNHLQGDILDYLARYAKLDEDSTGAEHWLNELLAFETAQGVERNAFAIGDAYFVLGDFQTLTRRFDDAERNLHKAIVLLNQAVGPQHPESADARARLGELLFYMGHRADAAALLNDALQTQLLTPQGVNDATETRKTLAALEFTRGRLSLAEQLLRQNLTQMKDHPGRELRYGISAGNLATVLTAEGQLAEARALYDTSLDVYARYIGEKSHAYAQGLCRGGDLAIAERKPEVAASLFERVLKDWPRAQGELPDEYSRAVLGLATADMDLGKNESVRQKVGALLREILGSPHRSQFVEQEALTRRLLGQALLRSGSVADAEVQLRRAVALRQSLDDADSPWLAQARINLAECLITEHKTREAQTLLKMAAVAQSHQPLLRESYRRELKQASAMLRRSI